MILNIDSADALIGEDTLDGKVITLYSFTRIKQELINKHVLNLADRRLVVVCPKKGLKAQKQLKDYEIIRDIRDDFLFTNNNEILKKELVETDPGVQVLIEEQGNAEAEILDYHSVSRVIFYLRNVPNGIQHMSQLLNGQVETSLNLGILELKEDALTSLTSIRSSVKTRKEDLCARVTMLVEMLGGEAEVEGDYPAWEYRTDSALRPQVEKVYEDFDIWTIVFSVINILVLFFFLKKFRISTAFLSDRTILTFTRQKSIYPFLLPQEYGISLLHFCSRQTYDSPGQIPGGFRRRHTHRCEKTNPRGTNYGK
jgi:hypothetical protein